MAIVEDAHKVSKVIIRKVMETEEFESEIEKVDEVVERL